MNKRQSWVSILTILALVPCLVGGVLGAGRQDVAKAPAGQAAVKAPLEETAATPRPLKERMAVYVLLAWVWVSIAVLLWLLRLRVKEADRVFHMGLRRAAGKTSQDRGR